MRLAIEFKTVDASEALCVRDHIATMSGERLELIYQAERWLLTTKDQFETLGEAAVAVEKFRDKLVQHTGSDGVDYVQAGRRGGFITLLSHTLHLEERCLANEDNRAELGKWTTKHFGLRRI